jgi:ABC-2 type transport system ATP-binding protein
MTVPVEVQNLGKQYGSRGKAFWALQDCTFSLPFGRIAGLVGPNGAGKTTLLHLLVGLLAPTSGTIQIYGFSPETQLDKVLEKVGFVGQNQPLYRNFTVREMLKLGQQLNSRWDDALAVRRLEQLEIPLDRQAGKLSGGQQAQVALVLALAKRPALLILDEPFANLDPLGRRQFMQTLMDSVAQDEQTVLISSHQVSDLERICDALIVLSQSQLLLAGDLEQLLAAHIWKSSSPDDPDPAVNGCKVISAAQTRRSSRLLLRKDSVFRAGNVPFQGEPVSLEDLILAYLSLNKEEIEQLKGTANIPEVVP